jgi:hypothetical protein
MTVENVSMRSHATGSIKIEIQIEIQIEIEIGIEIGIEIEIKVSNFCKLCG